MITPSLFGGNTTRIVNRRKSYYSRVQPDHNTVVRYVKGLEAQRKLRERGGVMRIIFNLDNAIHCVVLDGLDVQSIYDTVEEKRRRLWDRNSMFPMPERCKKIVEAAMGILARTTEL